MCFFLGDAARSRIGGFNCWTLLERESRGCSERPAATAIALKGRWILKGHQAMFHIHPEHVSIVLLYDHIYNVRPPLDI